MEKNDSLNKEATTPSCYLLTVAKHGVEVFRVQQPQSPQDATAQDEATPASSYLHLMASWEYTGSDIAEASPAANWLAVDSKEGLKIIDLQNNFTLWKTLPLQDCKRVVFSPQGTYLGVLVRPQQPSTTPNFSVWDTKTGQLLSSFDVPHALDRWPPITWSTQETFFFGTTTKAVWITKPPCYDLNDPWAKITVENVQTLTLSNEKTSGEVKVALFVPSVQKKEPYVSLWSVSSSSQPTFLTSTPQSHVQTVSFYWNHNATVVLVLSQSDVDRSGRSYYGTSSLTFMEATVNGCHKTIVSEEDGPVAACQWCPTTNEFVVISGSIHSTKLILYDGKTAAPKLSFGNARRNCLRFNSFGRFLCLAGFGNLPGEVDIWDKKSKCLLGQIKIPYTVEFEWAPDGRMILAATTTPRMRVDNCVNIIRYNGDLLDHVEIPHLYSAKWLPAVPGTHTNRAPSPERLLQPPQSLKENSSSFDTNKYQPYRVPLASETSQRLASQQVTLKKATPVVATVITAAPKLPPGAQFVDPPHSKSYKRNALRRKKNKEAKSNQDKTPTDR